MYFGTRLKNLPISPDGPSVCCGQYDAKMS
jgi:hypothetical protein